MNILKLFLRRNYIIVKKIIVLKLCKRLKIKEKLHPLKSFKNVVILKSGVREKDTM